MKNYNIKFSSVYIFFLLSFVFGSCKHETHSNLEAPANLVYTPNSITSKRGFIINSNVPSIVGSNPIKYSLSVIPDAAGAISIEPSTGVISSNPMLTIGEYKVTVLAENSMASTTFASAFTINITDNPDLITFENNIKPLIQTHCSPCHVAGGSKSLLENFANSSLQINSILNRVNRMEGEDGFMPKDETKLSDSDIALIKKWQTDGLLEN